MKITWSIFPKFYRHLDVKGLAGLVRDAGLDTTNLTIRRGYWVEPETMAKDVPAFVGAMKDEGITVTFATAGFDFEQIMADPTPLKILADSGVTDFRPAYFRPAKGEDIRAALEHARDTFERLAPVCEKTGTRCVYQIHHGTLCPSPTGLWSLIKDLPPEAIGVMLDPGNQCYEGWEKWDRSMKLLGGHAAAFGVKDTRVVRDESRAAEPDKGWSREWCPCDEGAVNWYEVARACKANGFAGTFVLMPFYFSDEPVKMTATLAREVQYLRRVFAEVEAEE